MKIYFETLGCPKNIADSEYAAGLLESSGDETVNSPEEADVIVVNTCGFIEDAKQESIDAIFEMAAFKKEGKKLIVTGCLAQRYKEELQKEIPEADLIIGVNEYPNLPELLHGTSIEITDMQTKKMLGETYTAYLKIAEGCDNCCTYCVIPSIRGSYKSRPMEELLKEAKFFASKGCRELVVVAQDTTKYGIDLYDELKLPELLNALCEIEGIKWIRLMYCYEESITEDLIQTIKKQEKVCKYLDIPIQHCNDNILKAMNRKSTNASIRNTLGRLRTEIPDIHIRTTVITGFPGETKEYFEELETFIEEMKFDRLGVFHYSKEEGTPAAKIKGQIREATKLKRKDILMEVQRNISLALNERKIGKIFEVLIEEATDDPMVYLGRTRYDAIDIDNAAIVKTKSEHKAGDLIKMKVTDAFDYDLVGEEI